MSYTKEQQTLREAFEAWVKDETGNDVWKDENGKYYPTTDIAWKAWQAAARWADK